MKVTWRNSSQNQPENRGAFADAFLQELNGPFKSEWKCILENPDPESFAQEVLTLGQRLRQAQQDSAALKLLQWLATQTQDPQLQARAQNLAAAIVGSGAAGDRVEYLVGRFAQDASDYRTIIPMIAGSAVGQVAGSFAFGSLAGSTRLGFFSKGLPAHFAAGSFALALELQSSSPVPAR